jgi:hypothetical protein
MSRTPPRSPAILTAALHAAGRGWPVFPLRAGGKTPAIRAAHEPGHPCRGECGRDGHGFHDATTDPAVIEAWWRSAPRANYGISTGPAGLVVIDLDTGKGTPPGRVLPDQGDTELTPPGVVDGADVLTWIAERVGARIGWGDTLTVTTPSGGTHLFYAAPAGVEIRSSTGHNGARITGLGWSIDVRAVGGYVVGPGSHGPKGTADGYAAIIKGAVQTVPPYLLQRLTAIGSVGDRTPCTTGSAGGRLVSVPGARIGTGTGYGAAALAGELANIAASQAGDTTGSGRNATLNRAAFKIGRLLDTCALDPDQVSADLLAAGQAVGLCEREAAAAIASGLAQGRARAHPSTPPVRKDHS